MLNNGEDTNINFMRISRRLEQAEKAYRIDQNSWGLGLTYNMLGELYSTKEENFKLSVDFFHQAINHFEKCHHYRGCCTAAQNLTKICEKQKLSQPSLVFQDYEELYRRNKQLFNEQRMCSMQEKQDKILWEIVCSERKNIKEMHQINYEITLDGVKSIGNTLVRK